MLSPTEDNFVFDPVKSFDANIAIICNFVLLAKSLIHSIVKPDRNHYDYMQRQFHVNGPL